MSLSVGIVGLPNVGKSTLFNALLKRQQALAANYPFATIEPNVGIVPVPDGRLDQLAEVVGSQLSVTNVPIVPATVEFVDIAGIVAGAHKGEGLGNQFLTHIREVSLIAQVVRHFDDDNIIKTGTGLKEDYEVITSELILKDLETVEKRLGQVAKQRNDKEAQAQKGVLEKLVHGFNEGKRAKDVLNGEELDLINDLFLLSSKDQLIVANVGEVDLHRAESMAVSVAQILGVAVEEVVVISAKIESELAVLSDEDQQLFMTELGLKESGLERLIKSAYSKLGLMSFLTAGVKEVRAWTIREGTTAVEASGVIHTDFMQKFIKAEVVGFDDFMAYKGWKGAREEGKVRLEGREYVMKDGDVVEFKIGS